MDDFKVAWYAGGTKNSVKGRMWEILQMLKCLEIA
jgi:hypothetical protein